MLTWNSRNLPTRISQGSTVVDFSYNPDGARYQQIKTVNGTSSTTLYIGGLYEQVTQNGTVTHKNYLSAAGRTLAIRETTHGTHTLKYLHQDHLGSTDVVTNSTGQILERSSFDAFGSRRNSNWTDPVAALTSLFTTRGYTGHEQLDEIGLIHMNGRVYDPALGRFLSADPYVKYPEGAQGLNRYSYVDNNPLSRVDPSGFGWLSKTWKKIKKGVKKILDNPIIMGIAAIVVAPWAGLYIGTTYGLSTAAGYAISGFTAGFIASGGSFKAGAIGAVTALGFYGIGNLAQAGNWGFGERALAHGVVGGASSVAQGGKFKHGLLSAGFTSLSSPVIGAVPGGWVGRTVAASVVGGTASELGGGKFANGAITGAFSRLFNDEAGHSNRKKFPKGKLFGENLYDVDILDVETRARVQNDPPNVYGHVDLQVKIKFGLKVICSCGENDIWYPRNAHELSFNTSIPLEETIFDYIPGVGQFRQIAAANFIVPKAVAVSQAGIEINNYIQQYSEKYSMPIATGICIASRVGC